MAPLPEHDHPPYEQKFGEAEGEYHGGSYQLSWVSFYFYFPLTFRIILDPYAVRGGSRQDLGIRLRAAAWSRGRPCHRTAFWVDAGTTWLGDLPAKVLGQRYLWDMCQVNLPRTDCL